MGIMYPFFLIGATSVVAIFVGLLARDSLGTDFSNILLFGGIIVGCLNAVIASLFNR